MILNNFITDTYKVSKLGLLTVHHIPLLDFEKVLHQFSKNSKQLFLLPNG